MGDLLPVFEEYCTKDIDDVKIGALSHLAEFFEVRTMSVLYFNAIVVIINYIYPC